MSGYRDGTDDYSPLAPHFWRVTTVALVLAYMLPLVGLWSLTDFPSSFGIHIAAHGAAGLLRNWYFSYLLIERHEVLDVLTFLWMWLPLVVLVACVRQFAGPVIRKLRTTKFSLYSDPVE